MKWRGSGCERSHCHNGALGGRSADTHLLTVTSLVTQIIELQARTGMRLCLRNAISYEVAPVVPTDPDDQRGVLLLLGR